MGALGATRVKVGGGSILKNANGRSLIMGTKGIIIFGNNTNMADHWQIKDSLNWIFIEVESMILVQVLHI